MDIEDNPNSAANMVVMRHIALNLIKNKKTAKVGIKTKRLNAGWGNNYFLNSDLLKIFLGEKKCKPLIYNVILIQPPLSKKPTLKQYSSFYRLSYYWPFY